MVVVVELTDPLFGGILGIGLFLILKGKWRHALLYVLPPVALHFCHNMGVIVLCDVPWWPAYFMAYTVAILLFSWEYICMFRKTEIPVEKPIMPANVGMKFVRRM